MPCRAFPQTYPMWEVRICFYLWVGCKSSGLLGFCAAVALSGSKACHSFLYRLSGGNRPKGGGLQAPRGVDEASIAARAAGEKRRTGGTVRPPPRGGRLSPRFDQREKWGAGFFPLRSR